MTALQPKGRDVRLTPCLASVLSFFVSGAWGRISRHVFRRNDLRAVTIGKPRGFPRFVRSQRLFSTSRPISNGTNWTFLEDVALCTSWVEVTHSSCTGNEMQLREMWSLIHTNYLEKMGGSRTKESMSSRWKLLSQSFTIWRDALAQPSSNLRSEENYTD